MMTGLLAVPALVKAEENEGHEQNVAWKDLPVAVQNTLTNSANGSVVGELEMEVSDLRQSRRLEIA